MDFAGISEENRLKTFNEVVNSLKELEHVIYLFIFYRESLRREAIADQAEVVRQSLVKLNQKIRRKGTPVLAQILLQKKKVHLSIYLIRYFFR